MSTASFYRQPRCAWATRGFYSPRAAGSERPGKRFTLIAEGELSIRWFAAVMASGVLLSACAGRGATGPQGSDGTQGEQGSNGTPGTTGQPGSAGPQGPAGPTGPTGPQGAKGPAGPAGAQGAAGPAGAQGPVGPAGVSGYGTATTTQTFVLNNSGPAPVTVQVSCPSGKNVLGGGFSFSDNTNLAQVTSTSYPFNSTTWTVTVASDHVVPLTETVYAICAG